MRYGFDADNIESILKTEKVNYTRFCDTHFRIEGVDFWNTTERWQDLQTGRKGKGYDEMWAYIRRKNMDAKQLLDIAKKEVAEESNREEIERIKVKLREKKSLWDKVFPFKIVFIRKTGNEQKAHLL